MLKIQKLFIVALIVLGSLVAPVYIATPVSALDCAILPDAICNAADNPKIEQSGTWLLLIWVINILAGLVGVTAIAMIAFASFQYATAGGNAEQTKKAIEMIRNVVIALLIFALMWSVSNWLIPGGIFA